MYGCFTTSTSPTARSAYTSSAIRTRKISKVMASRHSACCQYEESEDFLTEETEIWKNHAF